MISVSRFFLLICLSSSLRADVRQLYSRHCAVCHGAAGEGGLGSSLIDGNWQHGAEDADLSRHIHDGLPELGMQGFGQTLNDQEIRSLVVYLRELEHQAKGSVKPALTDGVYQTRHQSYRVEILVEHSKKMWGLSFLPEGQLLVTEIDGALRRLDADGILHPPVVGTPAIARKGQGGMLDVAVHPNYAENGWVYLAFADGIPERCLTSIVRGRIRDNHWVDEQIIFRADEKYRSGSGVHFGCRIVVREGYVFFAIGDRGAPQQAQDLNRPNGKIHRLFEDGHLPADNPFVGESQVPSIWSYGHRNPQALAFRPDRQELWSTEHGPRGGDELNLIHRGRNYGWPTVTFGMNYNGTPITEHTALPGLESPVRHWTPSIATCGMAFIDGDRYPGWKGDLLVGGLRAQVIERLRISADGGIAESEVIMKDLGRVRDIKSGPDGLIYVILEGDGSKLVRLRPVD